MQYFPLIQIWSIFMRGSAASILQINQKDVLHFAAVCPLLLF